MFWSESWRVYEQVIKFHGGVHTYTFPFYCWSRPSHRTCTVQCSVFQNQFSYKLNKKGRLFDVKSDVALFFWKLWTNDRTQAISLYRGSQPPLEQPGNSEFTIYDTTVAKTSLMIEIASSRKSIFFVITSICSTFESERNYPGTVFRGAASKLGKKLQIRCWLDVKLPNTSFIAQLTVQARVKTIVSCIKNFN